MTVTDAPPSGGGVVGTRYGIHDIDMPATPQRVWQCLKEATK
jgi:hypothetical protein